MYNTYDYDIDPELVAVNSVLGAIGQAPVQRLEYKNPEISFIYNILNEVNLDVQNEGWTFNREEGVVFKSNDKDIIPFPPNVLRIDISEGQTYRYTDVVRREGKLYDKQNHTYKFPNDITCDVTWRFNFKDLPEVFRRYITAKASVRAATQLLGNADMVKILAQQEAISRAAAMEYECNQGDYTFFGTPKGTAYRSYQPYRTLAR